MITDSWNSTPGERIASGRRKTQQRQLRSNGDVGQSDGIANQAAIEVQPVGDGAQTAEHGGSLLLAKQFTKTAEPATRKT